MFQNDARLMIISSVEDDNAGTSAQFYIRQRKRQINPSEMLSMALQDVEDNLPSSQRSSDDVLKSVECFDGAIAMMQSLLLLGY